MTVKLDELSWPEIAEILKKPNAVILPVGSTEQHGAHLPVNIDSAATMYVAERAAQKVWDEERLHILVAPPVHYGEVSHHRKFPGTIGVKADTLIRVLAELNESFLEQGFNNVMTLTGHRENAEPLVVALTMVAEKYPGANLFGVNIMGLGFDVRQGLVKAGLSGTGHALEVETSEAMVIQPQNVHLERAIIGSRELPISSRYLGATGKDTSRGVLFASGLSGFEESGTFGDPTKASREEGETILSSIINDVADIVTQMVKGTR